MALVFQPRITPTPSASDPTITTQVYAFGAETPFAGAVSRGSIVSRLPQSALSPAPGNANSNSKIQSERQLLSFLQALESPNGVAQNSNPFLSNLSTSFSGLAGLGNTSPNALDATNNAEEQQLLRALFIDDSTSQITPQALTPAVEALNTPLLNGADSRQLSGLKNLTLPVETRNQIQKFVSESITKVSPMTEAAGTYARAKQINHNPFNQDSAWFNMQGINVDVTGDSLSKQSSNGDMMNSNTGGQQDPREQRRQKQFTAVA